VHSPDSQSKIDCSCRATDNEDWFELERGNVRDEAESTVKNTVPQDGAFAHATYGLL
jgi:hypothetical protein